MSNTTISPNMNMPIPVVGVDPGPDYATDQNSCFTIIDQHDHSAGNGVPITPDGMDISSDLTFANHSATNLYSLVLTSQSGALTGTNFLSSVSGNLYFNDGSGNQVQITSAGGVAGSPGSIGSLTSPASATYSAGSKLFTWASGVNKSAAMDNGAITIRETDVASAKGTTIASAASLAADYTLTLPGALPGSTQYFASSSGGTVSFVTSNSIAAARTRATGTTVGAGGVAISGSSGNFTTTSSSAVDITNLSITITTSGRPVFVGFMDDYAATGQVASIGVSKGATATEASGNITLYRDATAISSTNMDSYSTGIVILKIPPGSVSMIDAVAAGTYTYKAQANAVSPTTTAVSYCKLVVYEL